MTDHPLKQVIEAADRAITARDFDAVMEFYAEDAVLVVKTGILARGKAQIREALVAIDAYFGGDLTVTQGEMHVVEGADTALIVMETHLDFPGEGGLRIQETRRATYVFRKEAAVDMDGAGQERWLCAVDNSYGTDLLDPA